MLNRYDATQQSRVDCEFARKYDTAQSAFTDCEFVRAYDATEGAWVDKLFSGYFTLQTPTLASGDELVVTPNEITLYTTKTAERRHVRFEIPFKWAGELVEFDVVSNGVANVYFGKVFYVSTGTQVSGYDRQINGAYDDHVTIQLGTRGDDYEGYPITSSEMYFEISISADSANTDIGYVNIRNVKISGKKYGFTE